MRSTEGKLAWWMAGLLGIAFSAIAGCLGGYLGAVTGSEHSASHVWNNDGPGFVILGSAIGAATALPAWGWMTFRAFRGSLRHEALGFGACVVLASLPVSLLAYGLWSGM